MGWRPQHKTRHSAHRYMRWGMLGLALGIAVPVGLAILVFPDTSGRSNRAATVEAGAGGPFSATGPRSVRGGDLRTSPASARRGP